MGRRPEGTGGRQAPKFAGAPQAGLNAPALRPELDVQRLYQMGRAAIAAQQPGAAIEALERVVCLQPNHVDALTSLIHAHVAGGNTDDALSLIPMLRSRQPDTPMADFEEARLWSDLGEIDKARDLLLAVTKAHPSYAPAWHALAKVARVSPDDALIDRLLERISKAEDNSNAMMFLCMGLAKAYDDIGEYDLAFDYQVRAKRQTPLTYVAEEDELRFRGLREVFTKPFFSKREGYGATSNRPVFVVGMPRSGTSLTEQILASHPDVFGAGEVDYLALGSGEIRGLTPDNAPLHRAVLKLGREAAAISGNRYLRRIAQHDRSHLRVIDKTPHNFLCIGLIGLILPNAKIIHCQREPIDVCLSLYLQFISPAHGYAHNLNTLGRYYQLYAELLDHWREQAPLQIFDSMYSDLIDDQRGQTERLSQFIGLTWDERMMSFHQTQRRVATPSRAQVRNPIHSGSKARWRRYAHRLGPLIDALGPHAPSGF